MRLRLPAFARTTTFRLALLYVILIAVYSAGLLGYLYHSTVGYMRADTDARISAEIDSLYRAYLDGGLERVSQSLIERASTPDTYFFYQLTTPGGQRISGDLSGMPEIDNPVTGYTNFTIQARHPDGSPLRVQAEGRVVELGNDARLLVAFDAGQRGEITQRITGAVYTASAAGLVLSLIGGILVSRSVVRRAEGLASTAEAVMGGDLSRRAPERGTNDEFDRLAERMNAMLDKLEHLVKASRHTGDAIAHDLRSPLSRMRNRLETALGSDLSDERAASALGETIEEVDRILSTFNAILRLSSLEAGAEGRLRRLDVNELVTEMADLFEPAAEVAGLSFKADPGRVTRVLGDRDLIAQALSNLIDNAIKYTPEGGAIHVRVRRSDEGMVDITVKDTGPGIPECERERVKKRFVRMDLPRTRPGSGLGLAMVEAVADLHRGVFLLLDGDGPPERPGLKAVLRLRRA